MEADKGVIVHDSGFQTVLRGMVTTGRHPGSLVLTHLAQPEREYSDIELTNYTATKGFIETLAHLFTSGSQPIKRFAAFIETQDALAGDTFDSKLEKLKAAGIDANVLYGLAGISKMSLTSRLAIRFYSLYPPHILRLHRFRFARQYLPADPCALHLCPRRFFAVPLDGCPAQATHLGFSSQRCPSLWCLKKDSFIIIIRTDNNRRCRCRTKRQQPPAHRDRNPIVFQCLICSFNVMSDRCHVAEIGRHISECFFQLQRRTIPSTRKQPNRVAKRCAMPTQQRHVFCRAQMHI